MNLSLKSLARTFPLKSQAALLARLLPPHRWYAAVLRITRLYRSLATHLLHKPGGISEGYLRDSWFNQLTRLGPFPIPLLIETRTAVAPTPADPAGLLLCGTHLPLSRMVLRALIELGHPPAFVLADPGHIFDNRFFVPGIATGLPTILNDTGALLKVRTALLRGNTVAVTLDANVGKPISPTMFQLAARLHTRILFHFEELLPGGEIKVVFHDPPFPHCTTEAEIQANLEAITRQNAETLQTLRNLR